MHRNDWSFFFILVICLLLTACDNAENYAPVVEISNIESIPKNGMHRVKSRETLYEIAWRYGLDYRILATYNHIQPPYILYKGQWIYLRPHRAPLFERIHVKPMTPMAIHHQTRPIHRTRMISSPQHESKIMPLKPSEPDYRIVEWLRPAKGRIINSFSRLNKGVNIAGHLGDAIYAAAPGKVVYCGDGLRGYGNLVIIKHNSIYLSAYAHNSVVFVKEGDWVKQGQKIAEMGSTGSDRVMLHFEIRRAGKSVDPMKLL